MKLIGLTGGIASGKSTVSEMIRDLGYPVLDADQIARYVTKPGTSLFQRIIDEFDVLTEDGQIDRPKLGALVFSDPKKLERLNSLVHPWVHKKAISLIDEYQREGCPLLFYEVPLLYETGMQDLFDAIVVVYITTEMQVQRLMDRNGLSEEDAFSRVTSQWTPLSRMLRSDYTIVNMTDLEDLRKQVGKVISMILVSLDLEC